MRHAIYALLATALFAAGSTVSHAREGVPSDAQLGAMGLTGMQILSDTEALDIRGFGYDPWHGYGQKAKKSVAVAYGSSYAGVAGHGAEAYSEDGFYAEGRHGARGEHGSHAGIVVHSSGKKGAGKGGRRGGGKHAAAGKHGGGKRRGGKHGGGKRGGGKPQVKKVVAFSGGFSSASTK